VLVGRKTEDYETEDRRSDGRIGGELVFGGCDVRAGK
jgi:hypothetical protein